MKYTKSKWEAFRFSQFHNWKVRIGERNEFLDLGRDEESEGDARIIAASKDMYEALKSVKELIEMQIPMAMHSNSYDLALKALSKAEKDPGCTEEELNTAYARMQSRIVRFSDEFLLSVWEAINSPDCHPEYGYGSSCGEGKYYKFITIPFDDWSQAVYSEIEKRGLKT